MDKSVTQNDDTAWGAAFIARSRFVARRAEMMRIIPLASTDTTHDEQLFLGHYAHDDPTAADPGRTIATTASPTPDGESDSAFGKVSLTQGCEETAHGCPGNAE